MFDLITRNWIPPRTAPSLTAAELLTREELRCLDEHDIAVMRGDASCDDAATDAMSRQREVDGIALDRLVDDSDKRTVGSLVTPARTSGQRRG